ncbi:KGK domain-containing protein [Anabaena azotica]|uniref:KGK domain-containing protein n=1 Tax=Anabaena azotica FACHB-119 TaxID=947527 RepID=A0ABR8DFI8_9NOST|nr:KGK domain-containing protein [Anabaena azotica]MBD2505160.1 hypothetical protein [Anabaena azotica FACHB-119]
MCELNDDDVVAMDEALSFADKSMSKYQDLIKGLQEVLTGTYRQKRSSWLTDGVECEVLRVGEGWLKGRMRLNLEFIPDTPEKVTQYTEDESEKPGELKALPESPLDDLRAELLDT